MRITRSDLGRGLNSACALSDGKPAGRGRGPNTLGDQLTKDHILITQTHAYNTTNRPTTKHQTTTLTHSLCERTLRLSVLWPISTAFLGEIISQTPLYILKAGALF
jgi:hypothetical protein